MAEHEQDQAYNLELMQNEKNFIYNLLTQTQQSLQLIDSAQTDRKTISADRIMCGQILVKLNLAGWNTII